MTQECAQQLKNGGMIPTRICSQSLQRVYAAHTLFDFIPAELIDRFCEALGVLALFYDTDISPREIEANKKYGTNNNLRICFPRFKDELLPLTLA
jgi:hypothetical protein